MNFTGKSMLITGASGFIGSFIVERALAEGAEVWAAMRPTSSRRYLRDSRIHFIELDLNHADRLQQQLQAFLQQNGKGWDYVYMLPAPPNAATPPTSLPPTHKARKI